LREALKHPDVGIPGIMQWFTSDPAGLAMMNAPGGGNSYIVAEAKRAKGALMAQNPDLKDESPELLSKLDRLEPQIMMRAAAAYLEAQDPAAFEQAKVQTPWFFEVPKEKERGITNDSRLDPKVRKRNVSTWKTHAQTHFNEYMQDTTNDPSIDAAIDDLEQWLGAAVYGDTDEPELQAITAARGQGTTRYVSEILEQVPKHIRGWWPKSGIAREENLEEARIQEGMSGKYGPRGMRRAARKKRLLDKKKSKGLLP
jgi:hypothetical protein